MSQLTEDEAKLSRMIGEISGDSPITKTDSDEFRELLQNQEKARKWDDHHCGVFDEYEMPFDTNNLEQNQQIRKAVEIRLDMAKTLKDNDMILLFTDILRGR